MNRKRAVAVAAITLAALVVLPGVCLAAFPTVEEALVEIFGEDVEITTEGRELDCETLLRLEEQHRRVLLTNDEKREWGCPLAEDYEEAMAELAAAEYQPKTSFEFFHASKDGERLGAAVIVDAPGKWGMVDYVVGLDLEGAVTRVEILKHQERRGKGISRRTFLTQFEGKTAEDDIKLMKDITGVSGATVSSRSACAAVTKAVVLYKEFYLTEKPATPPAAETGSTSEPEAGEESVPELAGEGESASEPAVEEESAAEPAAEGESASEPAAPAAEESLEQPEDPAEPASSGEAEGP